MKELDWGDVFGNAVSAREILAEAGSDSEEVLAAWLQKKHRELIKENSGFCPTDSNDFEWCHYLTMARQVIADAQYER